MQDAMGVKVVHSFDQLISLKRVWKGGKVSVAKVEGDLKKVSSKGGETNEFL